MESTLAVSTDHDTGAVHLIDRGVILHIGDLAVRHIVDGLQILLTQRAGQDLGIFQTGSILTVILQWLVQDPIFQGILNVSIVPGIRHSKLMLVARGNGMDPCRNGDSLCQGDIAAGIELPVAITHHKT